MKQLLYSLLSEECTASDSLYPANQILISAPGNLPILEHFFINNLARYDSLGELLIKHVTPFIKSPLHSSSPLTNLDILSSILPFAVSKAFHYQIYIFYRNELLADPFHYTFPYFIVFSHAVVLLSLDGYTALPLTEPDTVHYYTDLFNVSLKKSLPLITAGVSGEEQKDMQPMGNESLLVMNYQPCLAAFLTKNLISRYIKTDMPGWEELIQEADPSIRMLSDVNDYSCIFSREGLREFAFDGICPGLPSCCFLDAADRTKLLNALFLTCKNDWAFLRIVNPCALTLPKHLGFAISKKGGLDFSRRISQSSGFQHIYIREPGILDAFEDFYDYLCKSNLVYSKEQTLKEIEYVIAELANKML